MCESNISKVYIVYVQIVWRVLIIKLYMWMVPQSVPLFYCTFKWKCSKLICIRHHSLKQCYYTCTHRNSNQNVFFHYSHYIQKINQMHTCTNNQSINMLRQHTNTAKTFHINCLLMTSIIIKIKFCTIPYNMQVVIVFTY